MTTELNEILERIAEIEAKFDHNYHLQRPCPESRIVELCERARVKFSMEIPIGYLNFLRQMNGLNWNGVHFYPAWDFIGLHIDFYEFAPHLIFFGNSDIDHYVYDTNARMFQIVDIIGLDFVEESFEDFESLVVAALKKQLPENVDA